MKQRHEESGGLSSCFHPAVRLPRQFKMEADGGAASSESGEDRRKVDIA